ncbi:MAG: hypothetical protein JRI58_10035 [Deltaproteobacteria bacterium]|nr:hypothetical protein [Deltaproteobacteria bacterium]MBW2020155.1 hypothetical protein [Deltaproteobacteria bacterium]MBW2075070.1 hypothetical protein [Deltaproteobacteria bacterium]
MHPEPHITLKTHLLKVARKIDHLLSEVIFLQRDSVVRICSACEAPCCKRVQYLFDEKDLIFAKVLRRNGVPRRKHKGRGCPFLSPTGCILTPKARPFVCHRYLCSNLKEEMARQDPELPEMMSEKIRMLEDLRGRLWKEYLQV